jgi:hypothetical protein
MPTKELWVEIEMLVHSIAATQLAVISRAVCT